MKKIGVLLVVVFSLFSCSSSEEQLIVPENKMVKIMYELMAEKKSLNYKGVSGDSVSTYFYSLSKPKVLEKYNVNVQEFDSTYMQLVRNPKRLKSFWGKVKVVSDSTFNVYK